VVPLLVPSRRAGGWVSSLADLRTSSCSTTITTQFLEGTTRLLSLPPIPQSAPLFLHSTSPFDSFSFFIPRSGQPTNGPLQFPANQPAPSLVEPIDPLGPPQRTLSRRRPKRFSSASLAYSPDPSSRPSSLPSKTSRTPTTRPQPSRLTPLRLRNPSRRDQTHRPLRPRP
jgi:hypothetical protein